MTKKELVEIVAKATIKRWEDNTPEYIHKGKENKLKKILWNCTKDDLNQRYEILTKKGYI